MIALLSIFVFIFGTIIGSFLNVVILRYNTGRSIGGRSGCMHCNYKLQWYDLIPIFSWIFLRGRCRKCFSKISIQYPLVELATGLTFLSIFANLSLYYTQPVIAGLFFIWQAIIFSILIIIFVYDLRHKIIPNELSYTFAGLAFIQTVFYLSLASSWQLINYLDLFSGLLMFLPFWALWAFSKGRWIGLGDGKLALGIGWMLGFIGGVSAIVLAFWIGAVFSVTYLLITKLNKLDKNITMKTEIPFAPFLIIGFLIVFFWQIDFLGLGIFFNII